ncbi:MAG: peptidoglycan DD-metalloendopeptidase family protein [Solirubrobacterales bacterium]
MARVAAAALIVLPVSGAGVASARDGSISAGSVSTPRAPKLRDSICLTGCIGLTKAVVGSTIEVSGRNMSGVDAISFRTRRGKRVYAPVTTTTKRSAQTVVPRGARSGGLRARDAYRQKSELGKEPLQVRPKRYLRATGALHVADAEVSPNKAFYYGTRRATLHYVITGAQPSNDLRVDIVTPAGEVVHSFVQTGLAPNTTQTVSWKGTGLDGRPVASGWYSFRLSGANGQSMMRASASDASELGVGVFGYIFPIRGRHDFGSSGSVFGAGRSGHSHQGQDVMARCGKRLVAARGGKVQYSGYQGSAGNYLVIDQKGSGEDNAYMHLAEPSPLAVGERVRTGQYIGEVGDTGNAQGCHLHFEIWGAPGWYEGGQPYDPLPSLRAWDKYS